MMRPLDNILTDIKNWAKKYPALVYVGAMLMFMTVGALISLYNGQDMSWDLLNYHYYNPWAFLHSRMDIDYQPNGVLTYVNPLLDTFDYFIRSNLSPILSGIIIGAFHGINGWLIFLIAELLLKRYLANAHRYVVSVLLGVMSLLGAAAFGLIGISSGDLIITIMLLGSMYLLVSYLSGLRTYSRLIIPAYLILGSAVGLKLTAMFFAIPMLLSGLFIGKTLQQKVKHSFIHVLFFVFGVISTGGFWYVKMWQTFQNPVFPWYNAIFKSQYYYIENMSDPRWFPDSIVENVFYPFVFSRLQSKAAEMPFRDPRLAVLMATFFIALAIFITRIVIKKKASINAKLGNQEKVFWFILIISYVLWKLTFSYYRYAVVLEMLSVVGLALLAYRLINPTRLATAIVLIGMIAIQIATVPTTWGRIDFQKDNFGPSLRHQLSTIKDNSVVLMPAREPMAFLVPYLPNGSQSINIFGFTDHPRMWDFVEAHIEKAQKDNKKFYGITTAALDSELGNPFSHVGYVRKECIPINTYATTHLNYTQYYVCELQRI